MMSPKYLQPYVTLLRIRQKAVRRNVIIAGVLFGFVLFANVFSNLLVEPNNRSLFLNGILILGFGLSLVLALSRLDTIRGLIEFVDELQHEAK